MLLTIAERYSAATRANRKVILDDFVLATGYHRKHAIRVLRRAATKGLTARRTRFRLYDEAVREALVVLWEASDHLCETRLQPMVPILLESLQQHGHLLLDPRVHQQVRDASAATIDRLLAPARHTVNGHRHACATLAIRRKAHNRASSEWRDPPPGFLEVSLVAHPGKSVTGSLVNTLVLTDIASEWTERVALPFCDPAVVVATIRRLRPLLPFALLGLNSYKGSESLNESLLALCRETGLEFTLSRSPRKDDQGCRERDGGVVRPLVAHERAQGPDAVEALNRMYAASGLFLNFFRPSFKLASKTRVGTRVAKRHHPPATPCARLLTSDAVPWAAKERLRTVLRTLDPLCILDEARKAQQHVVALAGGKTARGVPAEGDACPERLQQGLAIASLGGEVRLAHQSECLSRGRRTREDPFVDVWPRVREWLADDPDRTAREVLMRLDTEQPGRFSEHQLRTLQRRLKEWRRGAVQRLVFRGLDRQGPREEAPIRQVASGAGTTRSPCLTGDA